LIAPENSFIIIVLTLSIITSSAYGVGRIHQWYKHGIQRDEAYRTGYDKASYSIMDMMRFQRPPDQDVCPPRGERPRTPGDQSAT